MDKGLMLLFWSLAEGNDEQREKAALTLVDNLQKRQKKSEEFSEELKYTLKRLVKGLSSTRKWARLGFATALTQVFRQFNFVTVAHVQDVINEELKLLKSDSKGEQSNVLLGRIMTYLAIVQSDKILQASGQEIQKIAEVFNKTRKDKPPLHHVCIQGLVQLIQKVSESDMRDSILPVLKEELEVGWTECQPDTLLLLLTAMKHKNVFNKKYFSEHWGAKKLICDANMKELGSVLAKSTSDHPIIHPVCSAVLTEVAKKPETLTQFWTTVINDFLLKLPLPKKFLCLQLIPTALPLVTSVDQVKVILADSLIALVTKDLSNKKHPLYPASRQLAQRVVSTMSSLQSGAIQVAVVSRIMLSPAGVLFDTQTKTSTLTNLIRQLNGEGTEQFARLLMDGVCGENNLRSGGTAEQDVVTKWTVETLTSIITQVSKATDGDWQLSILQFLFLHGFCHIKKPTKDIAHCETRLKKKLEPQTVKLLAESFFRAMNKLSTYSPGKHSKHHLHYTTILEKLVKYVQTILNSRQHVTLNNDLDEESLQHWNKVLHVVEKISGKNKKSEKLSKEHAFELLFLHMALQLFTDPEGAAESLEDLYVCYDKAFQKKKRLSSAEDEPEWIEVVTDLLLSFLSRQSHLLRVLVNNVFTILTPNLTKNALNQILDVLKSTGADEESTLEFEDDELDDENMEDDDDGGNDEKEDKSEDSMDDNEEDDDESEEEDESSSSEVESVDGQGEVDEHMKAKLKQALGNAASASGDESSDEDLSDSEMEKLDDTLAAFFKNMKKGPKDEKAKKLQLKHYKMRCLDLLEILIQQEPPAAFLLEIIEPLLQVLEEVQKEKDSKDLYQKAVNVYHSLVATRKLNASKEVSKNELLQRIHDLIKLSTKVTGVPMVLEVGKAILLTIRILLDMDSNVPGPSICRQGKIEDEGTVSKDQEQALANLDKVHNLLKQSIRDYCQKRESLLNHMLFHVILERQPVLMWPLFADLLQLAQDDSIRVFCRTHVCSMMATMISKNTVSSLEVDTWAENAAKITTELTNVLTKTLDEKHVKPKFVHDVLLVLHKVFQFSSDELLEKIVPGEFLEKLDTTKDRLKSKDIRGICNKLSQLIKRRLNLDQGVSKRQEKKKRKLELKQQRQEEKAAKKARLQEEQEESESEEEMDAGGDISEDNSEEEKEETDDEIKTDEGESEKKKTKKSKLPVSAGASNSEGTTSSKDKSAKKSKKKKKKNKKKQSGGGGDENAAQKGVNGLTNGGGSRDTGVTGAGNKQKVKASKKKRNKKQKKKN